MRDRTTLLGVDMARRRNRRWLVAVTYLSLLVLGTLIWIRGGTYSQALSFGVLSSLIVNGIIFGGYARGGLIKPFATHTPLGSPAAWHNDERELRQRDRMHFYAYRAVVALLLLALFLGTDPFRQPQMSHVLGLAGVLLGLTLPQALLLWTEPDVMAADDEAGES